MSEVVTYKVTQISQIGTSKTSPSRILSFTDAINLKIESLKGLIIGSPQYKFRVNSINTDAVSKMQAFINNKGEQAKLAITECRGRDASRIIGRMLHPSMDRTSPAHIGFQPWDPINNALEHGITPFISIENRGAVGLDGLTFNERVIEGEISDQFGMSKRALVEKLNSMPD